MGGWNLKSTKSHLKRVIGNRTLTFEEFATLLARIESILNSRPICPITDDPEDISALTPGHFLIGRPLATIPEYDVQDVQENRLSKWELVQAHKIIGPGGKKNIYPNYKPE